MSVIHLPNRRTNTDAVNTRFHSISRLFQEEMPARVALTPCEYPNKFPQVSYIHRGDQLVVEALVYGIDPNILQIRIKGRWLTLQGRKFCRSKRNLEMMSQPFSRTVYLPCDVESLRFKVSYNEPVLRIRLDKRESGELSEYPAMN